MHSISATRLSLSRTSRAARLLYTTATRRVVYQTPTEMYETPGKQKDPFKTVSSGYPSNDQGQAFMKQDYVHPEELDRMARETGKEAQKALDEAKEHDEDVDGKEPGY